MNLSETLVGLGEDQVRAFCSRVEAVLSVRPGGELTLAATPNQLEVSPQAFEQLQRGVAAVNDAISRDLLQVAPDLSVRWTASPPAPGEDRTASVAAEANDGWIDLDNGQAKALAVTLFIVGVGLVVVTAALVLGTIFLSGGNPWAIAAGIIVALVAGALMLMAFDYGAKIVRATSNKGVRIRFRYGYFLGKFGLTSIEIETRT
jgi:hypothetical protein